MRFFITELPIFPSSGDAPMTATASGCMIRRMARRMSSRDGRGRGAAASKSARMRTSTAVAPALSASTGLRSISLISGKSCTNCETFSMTVPRVSRFTPAAPRTPRNTAAPAMSSSMPIASWCEVGARRKAASCITSTMTPPMPKATSLPKLGSVTAPTMTSCAAPSMRCTCTPSIAAPGWWATAFAIIVA